MTKRLIFFACALCAVSCTRPVQPASECPYDLTEVVAQAGWTNVVPKQAVRWRQKKDDRPLVVDQVVLLGKRDDTFVLLFAYKHPVGGRDTWTRNEISVMYDWGDDWILGEQEYASLPGEDAVKEFLSEKWWDENNDGFVVVFEGMKPVEKPASP